jgi:hypothetical protein
MEFKLLARLLVFALSRLTEPVSVSLTELETTSVFSVASFFSSSSDRLQLVSLKLAKYFDHQSSYSRSWNF